MKQRLKLPKKINWKKKAWTAFSKYIRARGVCEFHQRLFNAGIPPPCACAGVFQACHKISRSKTSILFDTRNCFCGCSASNVWAHFHEVEWDKLWRRLWWQDVEYLEQMKSKKVKFNAWSFKMIADEYEAKLSTK
jgi:hypothetical protein